MAASGGDRRQRAFLPTRKDPILGTTLRVFLFMLTLNVVSGQGGCYDPPCDTGPANPTTFWLLTIVTGSFASLMMTLVCLSTRYQIKENEIFNDRSTKVNGHVYLHYTKQRTGYQNTQGTSYYICLKYQVNHEEKLLTVKKEVEVTKTNYDQNVVELAVLPERPFSGRPTNGKPDFNVRGSGGVYCLMFIFTCILPLSFASIAIRATIEQPSAIAWTLMGVAIIPPIAFHCLVRRCKETDMDKRLDQFDGDGKIVNEVELESCRGSNGSDDEFEVSDGISLTY
jgi:hypothetical protein